MFLGGATGGGPGPARGPRAPEPTPGAQAAAVAAVGVVAAVETPVEAAARTESGNRPETRPLLASKRRRNLHTTTKKVHLLLTVFWTL